MFGKRAVPVERSFSFDNIPLWFSSEYVEQVKLPFKSDLGRFNVVLRYSSSKLYVGSAKTEHDSGIGTTLIKNAVLISILRRTFARPYPALLDEIHNLESEIISSLEELGLDVDQAILVDIGLSKEHNELLVRIPMRIFEGRAQELEDEAAERIERARIKAGEKG